MLSDDIHVIVCKYLDYECEDYLEYVDRSEKLKYMYTIYANYDSYVEHSKVRHLKIYNEIDYLKYKNVNHLYFSFTYTAYPLAINIWKLPPSVKKITVSNQILPYEMKIYEDICKKYNIVLIKS